jgi:hypothetical protein
VKRNENEMTEKNNRLAAFEAEMKIFQQGIL